jgi:hypothetical protein
MYERTLALITKKIMIRKHTEPQQISETEIKPSTNKRYTVRKRLSVFPSLAGILFPARESLVSDILAGDGKTANLFFTL